jgi:rubrerythrin
MIQSKKFQRTKEDFNCTHCGQVVFGTGYTNHCPKCLWSKHVDINPGDRKSECGGMMTPVQAEFKAGEWTLLHRCEVCGFEKKNKTVPDDDLNAILKLATKLL